MKLSIVGSPLPNIPWQEKPAGNSDLMWRYDGNPVIGRRPLPRVTGIYNSAVVPWQGGFIGVFRTGGMDRVPHLHVGRSPVPVARKHCFAPKHGTNSRDLFRGFAFRLAACANPRLAGSRFITGQRIRFPRCVSATPGKSFPL